MAGILSTPVLTNLEEAPGSPVYQVDIDWTGRDNHVDLSTIRTRWAALVNGASSPAPSRTDFIGAANSTVRSTFQSNGQTYRYIDTVEIATSAQMGVSGTLSEENEALSDTDFQNKTVWVSSILEVA